MKFKIYKSTLLAQLSVSQRISLIGDFDLPDVFIFDGIPFEEGPDPIEEQYPEVRKALGAVSWQMFRELVRHPEGVGWRSLAKFVRSRSANEVQMRNGVAVQLAAMRRNFRKHGIRFAVASSRNQPGVFRLEPLT